MDLLLLIGPPPDIVPLERMYGYECSAGRARFYCPQIVIHYIATTQKSDLTTAATHTVTMELDAATMAELKRFLDQELYNGAPTSQLPLYVIINPHGGDKKAETIFSTIVMPMLGIAKISCQVVKTKHARHAQDLAGLLDTNLYRGILVVGGDGVIHETVNGLLGRAGKWQTRVPLGVIPAGTSNAIARSLGIHDPVLATMAAIKGHWQSTDAFLYEQGDQRFYGHLSLMWGLVADIDIGSEKYRWMGRSRIYWATLMRVLALRSYHATIEYIDADTIERLGGEATMHELHPVPRYKRFFDAEKPLVQVLPEQQYHSVIGVKHAYLDRDFCVSKRINPTTSADAIHLFLLKATGVRRGSLLRSMARGDGAGIHDDERWTRYLRVRAFKLRFRESEPSILDIDGEKMSKQDIYVESIPDALAFFTIRPTSGAA